MLPAVARAVEIGEEQYRSRNAVDRIGDRLRNFTRQHTRFAASLLVLMIMASAATMGLIYVHVSLFLSTAVRSLIGPFSSDLP